MSNLALGPESFDAVIDELGRIVDPGWSRDPGYWRDAQLSRGRSRRPQPQSGSDGLDRRESFALSEDAGVSADAVVPAVLALLVVAVDVWVYLDAKAMQAHGTPISFSNWLVTLDTPRDWAIACLFLFILVVPLYLTARRQVR